MKRLASGNYGYNYTVPGEIEPLREAPEVRGDWGLSGKEDKQMRFKASVATHDCLGKINNGTFTAVDYENLSVPARIAVINACAEGGVNNGVKALEVIAPIATEGMDQNQLYLTGKGGCTNAQVFHCWTDNILQPYLSWSLPTNDSDEKKYDNETSAVDTKHNELTSEDIQYLKSLPPGQLEQILEHLYSTDMTRYDEILKHVFSQDLQQPSGISHNYNSSFGANSNNSQSHAGHGFGEDNYRKLPYDSDRFMEQQGFFFGLDQSNLPSSTKLAGESSKGHESGDDMIDVDYGKNS